MKPCSSLGEQGCGALCGPTPLPPQPLKANPFYGKLALVQPFHPCPTSASRVLFHSGCHFGFLPPSWSVDPTFVHILVPVTAVPRDIPGHGHPSAWFPQD